jgi:hypothetical protein
MRDFDAAALEKDLIKFNKTILLTDKAMPDNKVVAAFKSTVDEISPTLPIITDLRNKALKVCDFLAINIS